MQEQTGNTDQILQRIKGSIHATDPDATILLYGSRARGDHRSNSDIDILILLEKDKISWDDEKRISFPLYAIEFDTGTLITPLILSKDQWKSKHKITPFYHKVIRDAKTL